MRFLGRSSSCSSYLLNRSPTKAVYIKTLYEAWWQEKPDASRLQVFGSVAYSLLDPSSRSKLDKKSEKCIFVGYIDETRFSEM